MTGEKKLEARAAMQEHTEEGRLQIIPWYPSKLTNHPPHVRRSAQLRHSMKRAKIRQYPEFAAISKPSNINLQQEG